MAKQYKQDQFVSIGDVLCEVIKLSCDPELVCKTCSIRKKSFTLCYECYHKVPFDCYPKPIVNMARKQYKPEQFYWIRGCQYRIARVERHVQDPCDFCALRDVCDDSMMNWCADLMRTNYYFKRV